MTAVVMLDSKVMASFALTWMNVHWEAITVTRTPDVTTLPALLIAHVMLDTLVPVKSAVTLMNVYLALTTVAIMRSAPILMVDLNVIVKKVIPVMVLPVLIMMNVLLE